MGKNNTKPSLNNYKEAAASLYSLLKGKTILGMYKWVKEHADYLIWFENYDSEAVTKVMNMYGETTAIFEQYESSEAQNDFLALSIRTVLELELNCK